MPRGNFYQNNSGMRAGGDLDRKVIVMGDEDARFGNRQGKHGTIEQSFGGQHRFVAQPRQKRDQFSMGVFIQKKFHGIISEKRAQIPVLPKLSRHNGERL